MGDWGTQIIVATLPHRSRLATFWREGHRQARKDYRSRWRRACLWLLGLCWIAGLFTCLSFISSLTTPDFLNQSEACQPDGSFAIDPAKYRYWSKSGFFQITLGSGNLTFTAAKAIDILWDLVGRGGQALLALISWRVFANYVTTSMEVTPVTFRTYRTIFLQNQNLLLAIPRMVRDFSRHHGLHSKIAMTFMVITMAFILSFPTFASAMTGYSGNVRSYIKTSDGSQIPFSSFGYALYIIHDGDRVGKGVDYTVSILDRNGDPTVTDDKWSDLGYCGASTTKITDGCYIARNVSTYIRQYFPSTLTNETSEFGNYTLQPPFLNISSIWLPRYGYLDFYDPKNSTDSFQEERLTWAYANETFSRADIEDNGSCQALLDYKWGFSFIQLFFVVIFLLLWTFGIYIMWLRSHIIMQRRGRKDVAGEHKAILELAEAMHEQIELRSKEDGMVVSSLPDSQLRLRINKDLRGGTISYETSLLPSSENGNGDSGWGFKSWVNREKWWLLALLTALGGTGGCAVIFWTYTILAMFVISLSLAFMATMYIGSTEMSRGILLFWSVIALTMLSGLIGGIVSSTMGSG